MTSDAGDFGSEVYLLVGRPDRALWWREYQASRYFIKFNVPAARRKGVLTRERGHVGAHWYFIVQANVGQNFLDSNHRYLQAGPMFAIERFFGQSCKLGQR